MKKVLLLSFVFLLFFGCDSKSLKIEKYDWNLSLVQNEIGESLEFEEHKLKAENGKFKLGDYDGEYILKDSSLKSSIYSVKIKNEVGLGIVSFTKYSNDEKEPTLIIKIGNYSLTFKGK